MKFVHLELINRHFFYTLNPLWFFTIILYHKQTFSQMILVLHYNSIKFSNEYFTFLLHWLMRDLDRRILFLKVLQWFTTYLCREPKKHDMLTPWWSGSLLHQTAFSLKHKQLNNYFHLGGLRMWYIVEAWWINLMLQFHTYIAASQVYSWSSSFELTSLICKIWISSNYLQY